MENQTNSKSTDLSFGISDAVNSDRLQELERFAEIGRLSASLLHEINNPLTAAIIWLEQCNTQKSPPIRHAHSSIRLLQRYVEAARQQVRLESRSRNFCVQSELRQAKHILSPLAKRKGIKLIFPKAIGCTLDGDPVKFQQIIANLVRNAIDSYDNCHAERVHKPVRLQIHPSQDCVVIKVSDRGCGIDGDQLDQLFKPFYSTKGKTGLGLGIGLFAVKRSVENDFSGTIRVRSSKRRGTRFIVKLRLTP